MSSLLNNLSLRSPASFSSVDAKQTIVLTRLERQISGAALELNANPMARGVFEKLAQNIAVARNQLMHALEAVQLPDAQRALCLILEKSIAARPHDVLWGRLLQANIDNISAKSQAPAPQDDGLQLRRVPNRLVGEQGDGAVRLTRSAARAPIPQSFRKPLPTPPPSVPQRPLTSQERFERAVQLSSQLTLGTSITGKQYLFRTDGAPVETNAKIKLDKAFERPLIVDAGTSGQKRVFRVSYLPDNGKGELVIGSLMASGTYAKVRPAILIRPDGSRERVVVKEQRLGPRRASPHKIDRNSIGNSINVVTSAETIKREIEMMKMTGGPAELIDVRQYDNKVLLVLRYMDGGSLEDLPLSPAERGPMARMAGDQLSAHSTLMHAQNIIHGDGKAANALLDLTRASIGHSDFGLSKKLQRAHHRYLKPIATYASPESAFNEGVTTKLDSWTLGITLIEILTADFGYPKPLYFIQEPQGSDAEKKQRRKVEEFASLREWLMPLKEGERKEVSLERLRSNTLREHSNLGRLLFDVGRRDEELGAYIIAHLLDPRETSRHSSAEAQRVLAAMARSQRSLINDTIERLREKATRAPDRVLFAHLNEAAIRLVNSILLRPGRPLR